MNKSQVIKYIIQVVVTDRFHCTYMDPKWPYTHRSPAVRGIFTSWRNVKHACNYFHLNDVWRLRIKYGPGVIPQLIKTINTNEKTVQLHAGNFHYIFNIRTHHTHKHTHRNMNIWVHVQNTFPWRLISWIAEVLCVLSSFGCNRFSWSSRALLEYIPHVIFCSFYWFC